MIHFCLHPGHVVSVSDGDSHKITAPQLADLYGVRMSECIVVDLDRPETNRGYTEHYLKTLLHLFPSHQGAAYWRVSETERSLYPLPWKPLTVAPAFGASPPDLEERIFNFCRGIMSPKGSS